MWSYLFRYHRRLLITGGLGFFLFFNYYGSHPQHSLRHISINSRDAVKIAQKSWQSPTATRAICTFEIEEAGWHTHSSDSLHASSGTWRVSFLDSTQTTIGSISIRLDGKIMNQQNIEPLETAAAAFSSRIISRLHYFEIAIWVLMAGAALWLMRKNAPSILRTKNSAWRLFTIVTAAFLVFGLNKTIQAPLSGNPFAAIAFWAQVGLSLFCGFMLTGTYFSVRNTVAQPEQLTSTETVLQGQWLNRTTALAFARGFLAAGMLLGIVAAVYRISVWLGLPIFSFANFTQPLTAPSPWTAIISGSLKQSLLVGLGLLLLRHFIQKVLSENMQILAGVLFLTLIHVSQLSLSPVWGRVLLDLILAVVVLLFFQSTDLLAGIIALFSCYAMLQAYPLMNTGNTFLAINGVSAQILAFLPLFAALRGFWRYSFVMPANWPLTPKNSE